jgi:hypothetical protein
MSPVKFKIIPYASNEEYYQNPSLCKWNFVGCLNFPGVWLLTEVYTPDFKYHMPLQLFFNSKLEL